MDALEERLVVDSRAALVRAHMGRVYNWMTGGLALTAATAWFASETPALRQLGLGGSGIVLFLVEIAMVWALSGMLHRLSVPVAMGLFTAFSALNGISLAWILLAYTKSSIFSTFIVTSGMFAGLSVYGYVTKRDLTTVGSYCMMAVWGLILASLVNMFLRSPSIMWLTTYVGVIVFVGLTAYDTQKIKELAPEREGPEAQKLAIYGALDLYLDFVNLFIYMLRLMGNRR